MTVHTAAQVAGYWTGAGGPKTRAVEWVAVSIGESSLDDAAVSPVGAIGLWQIMPFNAATYGYAVADLYNPAVNAAVAVAMSGGGVNCAAWDSCYADIQASGRYTFLAWPEQGSADYANLAVAAAELAGHGIPVVTSPDYPGLDNTLAASAKRWQQAGGQLVPQVTAQTASATRSISVMFRRGWR